MLYVCIRFKTVQIPQIAAQSSTGSTVTVYRLGDHVDITRGPLISTTQQLGRFSVTAVSSTVHSCILGDPHVQQPLVFDAAKTSKIQDPCIILQIAMLSMQMSNLPLSRRIQRRLMDLFHPPPLPVWPLMYQDVSDFTYLTWCDGYLADPASANCHRQLTLLTTRSSRWQEPFIIH